MEPTLETILKALKSNRPILKTTAIEDTFYDIFTNKVAPNNTNIWVTHVDNDSTLNDEEVDLYLAKGLNELEFQIWSNNHWLADLRRQSIDGIIEDALEDLSNGELEMAELDYNILEDLRDAVARKDISQPVADLVNRDTRLLRKTIINSDAWQKDTPLHQRANMNIYTADQNLHVDLARQELILDTLNEYGVLTNPTAADKQAVLDMVQNGPEYLHEGVTLDAIWNGKITDAQLGKHRAQGISLLFIDFFNGSGFDAKMESPVTMNMTPESPAFCDSSGTSWNEIAGLVIHAYNCDLETV